MSRIQIQEVWNADNPDDFKEKAGYSVVLADGTMAKMWLSQLEVAPKVGEWFEADMVKPDEGKKQWKAKSPQRIGMDPDAAPQNVPQASRNGSSRGTDYKADPDKLRAENYRSALHAAIALKPGASPEVILGIATQFHEAIEVAPARREGFSEVHPPASGIAETSRPAGAPTGEDDMSVSVPATSPDARPTDGGGPVPPSSGWAEVITQAAERVGCGPHILAAVIRGQGVESGSPADVTDEQADAVLAYLEQKAA